MLRRQSFVSLLLIAAVACLYFSPLLMTHGAAGRHPARGILASTAVVTAALLTALFSLSRTPPGERIYLSQDLLALHCARLC